MRLELNAIIEAVYNTMATARNDTGGAMIIKQVERTVQRLPASPTIFKTSYKIEMAMFANLGSQYKMVGK